MDEEKINEVCVRHGCIKLKLSKRPSWIDKTGLEGIEYDGFSIKPFWSIDGEREYDREPGQKIDDILKDVINYVIMYRSKH